MNFTEIITKSVILDRPLTITSDRINYLVSQRIPEEIAAIDLEMVKLKMSQPDEEIDWNSEQIEQAEVEYKRYLTLCKFFPKVQGYVNVPNKIMDTFWHYHILDTKAYIEDCNRVFGGYLHHFPYFGIRGEEDALRLRNAFEDTKARYEKTFKESMVRLSESDCWHDCQDRCWHACSDE